MVRTPLQDILSSAGLTRVSFEIEQRALLSLRLRMQAVDEGQLKPGTTKFGGSPDVPPGWVWPEYNGFPLPFVGQINVAEIDGLSETCLPASGVLSFFFDVDAFFETWPGDPGTWSVQYHEHSSPFALQRVALPEAVSPTRRYHACTVSCALEWTLPDYCQYDSTSLQCLGLSHPLTDEEETAYHEVQEQLAGRMGARYHTPCHRLLGHPDVVQWDMYEDLGGDPSDWLLLLQVDSDEATDTEWGDTGRIYYWIRKQDALRRDFRHMRLILQCT